MGQIDANTIKTEQRHQRDIDWENALFLSLRTALDRYQQSYESRSHDAKGWKRVELVSAYLTLLKNKYDSTRSSEELLEENAILSPATPYLRGMLTLALSILCSNSSDLKSELVEALDSFIHTGCTIFKTSPTLSILMRKFEEIGGDKSEINQMAGCLHSKEVLGKGEKYFKELGCEFLQTAPVDGTGRRTGPPPVSSHMGAYFIGK